MSFKKESLIRRIGEFAFILLLFGCVQPTNFDPGPNENNLVVDGYITTEDNFGRLRLSRVSTFGTRERNGIGGASVRLADELGNTQPYTHRGDGLYVVDLRPMNVRVGVAYQIEIDIDGETYISNAEVMPQKISADSAFFRVEEEEIISGDDLVREVTLIKIFVASPIHTELGGGFMRWTTDQAYQRVRSPCPMGARCCSCYYLLNENEQDFVLLNGPVLGSDRISELEVLRRDLLPHYEFEIRHYFNVFQYSHTETAFQYWQNIQQIANQSGSLFDPPPVPISGNIVNVNNPDELVLGYFETLAIDTVRTFTTQGNLFPHRVLAPEPTAPPCPGGTDPDVCLRPDYWGT